MLTHKARASLPSWGGRNTAALSRQDTQSKCSWETTTVGNPSTGTNFVEKEKNNLWVEESSEVPWRQALDGTRHFRKCSVERFSTPTHSSH